MSATLTQLAHDIAYRAAVSDIECFCASWEARDGLRTYDLDKINDNDADIVADVKKAARYLDLLGALVRQADFPNLVRFSPPPVPDTAPLDLGAWPFEKLGIVEARQGGEAAA